jgi:hypothetical protein
MGGPARSRPSGALAALPRALGRCLLPVVLSLAAAPVAEAAPKDPPEAPPAPESEAAYTQALVWGASESRGGAERLLADLEARRSEWRGVDLAPGFPKILASEEIGLAPGRLLVVLGFCREAAEIGVPGFLSGIEPGVFAARVAGSPAQSCPSLWPGWRFDKVYRVEARGRTLTAAQFFGNYGWTLVLSLRDRSGRLLASRVASASDYGASSGGAISAAGDAVARSLSYSPPACPGKGWVWGVLAYRIDGDAISESWREEGRLSACSE